MGPGRRYPARFDLDAETVPAKVNRSDAGVAHAGDRLEDLSFLARHSRSTCQACYTVIGKSCRRVGASDRGLWVIAMRSTMANGVTPCVRSGWLARSTSTGTGTRMPR